MSEKQQKSVKKGSQNKQTKRNDKKASNFIKPSAQELQALQRQLMNDFFTNQMHQSSHNIYVSIVNQGVIANIEKGEIKISEDQKNVASLMKSKQQQALLKITPEEMEMYEKEAKKIQRLKLIANLNKQLANKQPEQSIAYIYSKDQHQRKVREIIEEKQNRQKKAQETKQLMKQKMEKERKQAQERELQEKNQEKERKRIQIQEKITKQKQEHIHFLSADFQQTKNLEEIKKKVPLHVKMEDNFRKSVELPELEQKKQKYKELRDFMLKYSASGIKQYEKEYIENSKPRLSRSNHKKSASVSRISEITKKIPEKSEWLKGLLAQQFEDLKKKRAQHESYIEQKLKREQEYSQTLKKSHKPKIDQHKRQQILSRLVKQKQHLSKVGLDIDKRKIGLQYLSDAKKQAHKQKEIADVRSLRSRSSRSQQKSQYTLPSLKRSFTQRSSLKSQGSLNFLAKIRQNQVNKIMNSNESSQQKFQKLRIQAQKIQSAKQLKLGALKHNFDESLSKEASSLALNSLKAKINLIELMKKRQGSV